MSEEETRALLQSVPEVYRTEVNDLLLTALALAPSPPGAGRDVLLVDLEGHGREEIFPGVDLSGTHRRLVHDPLPGGAGATAGEAIRGLAIRGGQGAAARGAEPTAWVMGCCAMAGTTQQRANSRCCHSRK